MARTLFFVLLLTLPVCTAWAQSPPAQIDRATPRVQSGLTVLAVVHGDAEGQYTFPLPPDLDFLQGPRSNGPPGGIGLWVRGVRPPAAPPKPPRQFYGPSARPTADAHALNGDTLPVRAETASSGFYDDRPGGPPAPLFLVTLPGDYPVGYPAIDVNFSDGLGHSARWRLIRLAPTFHAIAPPVTPKTVFHGAGVILTARAFQDPDQSLDWQGIRYQVDAKVPSGTHWLLRVTKQQMEWDALHPGEREALLSHYGRGYRSQAVWMTALGEDSRGGSYGTVRTPYGKYNHFLRLTGELVRMASADETVTFHNLNVRQSAPPAGMGTHFPQGYHPPPGYEIAASPQTVTTPSGISVSLLPLSALPRTGGFFGFEGDNTILLALKFAPALPTQSLDNPSTLVLPRSPLYKKYHKPVAYFLTAQKPYYLENFFPGFGGYAPPGTSPPPVVATLRLPYQMPGGMRPVKHAAPDGRTFHTPPPPPPLPKHFDALTFTLSQRARLRALPVSFLLPIGPAPPPRRPFFVRPPLAPHGFPHPFPPHGFPHSPFPVRHTH